MRFQKPVFGGNYSIQFFLLHCDVYRSFFLPETKPGKATENGWLEDDPFLLWRFGQIFQALRIPKDHPKEG